MTWPGFRNVDVVLPTVEGSQWLKCGRCRHEWVARWDCTEALYAVVRTDCICTECGSSQILNGNPMLFLPRQIARSPHFFRRPHAGNAKKRQGDGEHVRPIEHG